MKGKFTIAASFFDEGSKMLDLLFAMMIICSKEIIGGSVIYEATCSSMFDGKDAINFVIGFKDGVFEAFPENEIIPEGYIVLNQQGGTFGGGVLFQTINKGKTVVEELAENISKVAEKDITVNALASIPGAFKFGTDYKSMKYPALFKFAKEHGFKSSEHPNKKKPTLIKYLDELKVEGNENIRLPDGVENGKDFFTDDLPDIKAYEVLVSDMVKNQSGFLDAGAVINENQEFEDSFEDMLKAGWIKEIEVDE